MKKQGGGTVWGFVFGLLVGLGIAFGIAVYVTKAPIFLTNRAQSGNTPAPLAPTPSSKEWNPNAVLQGHTPHSKVTSEPTEPSPEEVPVSESTHSSGALGTSVPIAVPVARETPDRLADFVKNKINAIPAPVYFVQLGAFVTPEDARALRAKLVLIGEESTLSEKKQSEHTVYRVRVGPYASREEAEKMKIRLGAVGFADTVLVQSAP